MSKRSTRSHNKDVVTDTMHDRILMYIMYTAWKDVYIMLTLAHSSSITEVQPH